MKKKVLALLLVLTVVVNLFPSAVFAAEYAAVEETKVTFTFTPKTDKALPGDEVEYSLSVLWKNIELIGLKCDILFPDGMTYVSGSGKLAANAKTELGFDTLEWVESNLRILGMASSARTEAVDSPIEIATFKAKVPVDAEVGKYEMQIPEESIEIVGSDFEDLPTNLIEVVNASPVEVEVFKDKKAVFSFASHSANALQGDEVEYSLSFAWQNFYLGGFTYTLNLPEGFTYVSNSAVVNSSCAETLGFDSVDWSDSAMTLSSMSNEPQLSDKITLVEVLTFKVKISDDAKADIYKITSDFVEVYDDIDFLSNDFILTDNSSLLLVEEKKSDEIEDFARFTLTADKTLAAPGEEITYTFTFNWTNELLGFVMQLVLGDEFTFVNGSCVIDSEAEDKLGFDAVEWTESSLKFTGYATLPHEMQDDTPVTIATFKVKINEGVEDGTYFIDTDYVDLESVNGHFESLKLEQMEFISPEITVSTIYANSLTLDKENISLTFSQSQAQLNAIVEPENANDKKVVWSSSDETVAKVDETGLVTRVGEGSAVIKASLESNAEIFDTCEVTVAHECYADTLTLVEEKSADCYNAGKKAYYECNCGKIYNDKNAENEVADENELIIAPLSHPASSVIKTDRAEPTHTDNGNIEYWTCSLCGDVFSDEDCTVKTTDLAIDALGHDDKDLISWTKSEASHQKLCSCGAVLEEEAHDFVWITDSNSTCVKEGVEHEECTVCGYTRYENTAIEKINHVNEKTEATDATCTEDGNIEYYTCTVCGNLFRDEVGTQEITLADTVVKATGHTYNKVVTAPTCTEQGYTTYTCTCGDGYEENYVDALGHTEGDWVNTTPATCTENGEDTVYCTVCDEVINTKTVPATGHIYTSVVTPPTCTEQGYTTYTCTCGDTYEENYVDALGHTEGDWVTTIEPTFDDKGEETKYCTVCGDILEVKAIEPIGHEAGEWVVYEEPTCESYGIRYRQCLTCKEITIEKIPALGHTAGEWTKEIESSCTTYGVDVLRCTVCDEIIDEKYTQASEHVLGEWVTLEHATCTTDGFEEVRCTECDCLVATRVIGALGHKSIIDKEVLPTCTQTGLTEGVHCDTCGEILVNQEIIDALGHTASEWEIVLQPTASEEGRREKKCTVCTQVLETDVIPANGVTISGVVTSFDDGIENSDDVTVEFIQNGEVVYTVTVTGSDTQGFEIEKAAPGEYTMRVSKVNHVTREYTVTVDGENIIYAKIHLIGDITGDGKVTMSDITLMNSHIKVLDELQDYELACADINGDGKVSMRDLNMANNHNKELENLWK